MHILRIRARVKTIWGVDGAVRSSDIAQLDNMEETPDVATKWSEYVSV